MSLGERLVTDLVNCFRNNKNRSPRDIAISCFSIYFNIKSIFRANPPIGECSIGIAVNK